VESQPTVLKQIRLVAWPGNWQATGPGTTPSRISPKYYFPPQAVIRMPAGIPAATLACEGDSNNTVNTVATGTAAKQTGDQT